MAKKYKFAHPHNVLFITGAPLSGKSTIAPLINSRLNNCVIQHMDVIRLLSQEVELQKPEEERNNYVFYGSTDAYKLVGDGIYSPEKLVKGYRLYSIGIASLLFSVFNKLNPEDIDNMTVEGVQLMPELVAPYLKRDGYSLVVLTADEDQFNYNRDKDFTDPEVKKKYSNDKVILVQNEILRQIKGLSDNKVIVTQNKGRPVDVVRKILKKLVRTSFITPFV